MKDQTAKQKYRSGAKGRATESAYAKSYCSRLDVRERIRERDFKRRHGMSRQDADRLIEAQGGMCALCDERPDGVGTNARLHVDHNHTTGKIRAMLCHRCNKALGLARENPGLLRKMADYIEVN